MFGDLPNYVDFFLLNDLVNRDYSEVRIFPSGVPLFDSSPMPKDVSSYFAY